MSVLSLLSRLRVKAWIVLKLLLQRVGVPRRATLYYPSVWGWRYPAFLFASLKGTEIFECARADLPFFLQNGPRRDFLFRVRGIPQGGRPTASQILAEPDDATAGFERVLRIRHDAYACHLEERSLSAPYFVHPALLRTGFPERASHYQHRERTVRVCFAGAVSSVYERLSYPIMNRLEVLAAARGVGPDVTVVTERAKLPRKGEAVRVLLVIFEGSIDEPSRPPLLDLEEYLGLLARSDFVIAPPGVVMPHCHNVIEAMAVGAVPILNYPDLFFPGLSAGHDCLVFSTEAELVSQVRHALSLSTQQVEVMRKNVLAYYETHLSPTAFGRKVQAAWRDHLTIHVNSELGRG